MHLASISEADLGCSNGRLPICHLEHLSPSVTQRHSERFKNRTLKTSQYERAVCSFATPGEALLKGV